MTALLPGHVYRLTASPNRSDRWSNEPVVFLGFVERPFDVLRAEVRIIATGEVWLVKRGLIRSL